MPPRTPATALQDPLLQQIAARGGVKAYPAHAILVSEDDRSEQLYVILSGRVKIYGAAPDGREVVYNTLGPGEYFGELSLDGGARSASVMTLESTRCAVVAGADLREFLAAHPDFALHLVHKLIGLVRRQTGDVKSLALDDVYRRLARLLDNLAADDGTGRRVVAERLTQTDIAQRIGASREMVSRLFKPLTEGGYVAVEGGCIVILRRLPARW
jgi:CRP/FNR family transcriptional regulator, cyclic AMP receptor protein